MQFNTLLTLAVAALAGLVDAAPAKRQTSSIYNIPGDPEYSVSEAQLQAAIDCPNGDSAPGTVLLIPGTGATPPLLYKSNFAPLLTANNIPWCNLLTPNLSLGDAQTTAEYIVYAANYLARSTGGPIRALTHSQGGLDLQWGLTFFPSARASLRTVVALAPDYRGTIVGPIVTLAQRVISGGKAQASVLQQNVGSNFLTALAAAPGGLSAWVPTTNIYTATDDVVQPEIGAEAVRSSVLAGAKATNIRLQDACFPVPKVTDHFTILVDPVAMFFALRAFAEDTAPLSAAERVGVCVAGTLPRFEEVEAVVDFTKAVLLGVTTTAGPFGMETYLEEEPPVRAYAL
ncbi:putative lipase B precursor [Geopyxis carbonaria]|nr:putative lipase B precursor [Geopyxis carbonaria]